MSEKWAEYSVDFTLDGKQWALPVMATSEEDAKRRIDRAAAFGKISGPWQSYLAWRGWWVPAYAWVRNVLRR